MNIEERKNAFIKLGDLLKNISDKEKEDIILQITPGNQWFTAANIKLALSGIVSMLDEKDMHTWLLPYSFPNNTSQKIGVIMAGNIPAVGFHDMLCVLIAGHHLHAKLSKDDQVFPKLLMHYLIDIEPRFSDFIHFQDQMKDIDAIICTGSDNSARYFNYYFDKIPRIIRKNRSSLGIIDGKESVEDLKKLGKDIFTYYGLGCRNISKILVPKDYNFTQLFEAIFEFGDVLNSNKYCNNYEYNRAIYLMNQNHFLDNNFLIIKESTDLTSPIGVLFYQTYQDANEILDYINDNQQKIQCIASSQPSGNKIAFGNTQFPKVWDYSDKVDTIDFLNKI